MIKLNSRRIEYLKTKRTAFQISQGIFRGLVAVTTVFIAFVASTHTAVEVEQAPMSLLPGLHLIENYRQILMEGGNIGSHAPVGRMLWVSLVMAMGISVGKIFISLLSAFAIVYFKFPGRNICFWLIFITLMLPVEVRIAPTYEVMANLHLLDSWAGLILPVIASATATFLFRQFFMTVPDELAEAARMDGAGPMRFFFTILIPLSMTNIAAMFVIQFIYGWNQYLWPLLVTNQESMYTIVMGIQRMVNIPDAVPEWNLIMAVALLGMLPPLLVVLGMQKLFVRGLVETEK